MSKGILLCFNSFPWGVESPFTVQLMKGEKEWSREEREGVEMWEGCGGGGDDERKQ